MREIVQDAAERAARYLDSLGERWVGPRPADVAGLEALAGPLPETPTDPREVLALLDAHATPATVSSAGGRYFGFVTGGSVPAAMAAGLLATAWDQNAALTIMSPAAARLEEIAIGWLLDVLRLPGEAAGSLVTGTTQADVVALAAARHAVLARAGWDVEARGLFGAPEITVVVGEEAHATLFKALGIVGLGRTRVVRVPTDAQGRMRADALPALSGPAIICIQSGNVNTGSFDPASAIVAHARKADAWVHVDGAFGLWAAAAPARSHLTEGVADADSWATDGHKWLNVPYDSGFAFVRDGDALRAALSLEASYLPHDGVREPMSHTPDSSRRARGVETWAALRALGRSGVADLVERCCRHATRFAEGLRGAGHEVLNEVVLNQVMVAFGDDARTRRVIEGVQSDGTCWCGGTVWRGRAAMRISVSSWATTERDVERSLDAILRVAARA